MGSIRGKDTVKQMGSIRGKDAMKQNRYQTEEKKRKKKKRKKKKNIERGYSELLIAIHNIEVKGGGSLSMDLASASWCAKTWNVDRWAKTKKGTHCC